MRESEHTITPMLLGTNLIVKHTKWTKNYDTQDTLESGWTWAEERGGMGTKGGGVPPKGGGKRPPPRKGAPFKT